MRDMACRSSTAFMIVVLLQRHVGSAASRPSELPTAPSLSLAAPPAPLSLRLRSRRLPERLHGNPLTPHFQHRQVFRPGRRVENHPIPGSPTSSTRAPAATPN